jgi:hypothetical protein
MNRRGNQLIAEFYRTRQQQIRDSILCENDDVILYSNTEEMIEYYSVNNCLDPIDFDPTQQATFEPKKELRRVPAEQRESVYRYEGDLNFEYESIVVTMPIVPNENAGAIFAMEASTYSSAGPPNVKLHQNALFLEVDTKGYGFAFDDDRVATEVNRAIESVKQWIAWKNSDIIGGNSQLKQAIRQIIEERKVKLEADKSRIEALTKKINIPLKQKTSEAATRIRLDAKPLVKRIKPTPQLPEDYVLDRSKVLDIITLIDNQGRQFEKTPKTYRDIGEEGLRDVILVGLNSVFEGKATGETFSAKGKTDIYLNIDKGNVLISECKLWSGQALYLETIDQLLGYLTWRHNFGIMITFVKQKNFTNVLAAIPQIIPKHSSYRSGYQIISANHYLSNHVLPHDDAKHVEIHHLFYNLYAE